MNYFKSKEPLRPGNWKTAQNTQELGRPIISWAYLHDKEDCDYGK